jgi:hypothetical protein
MISTQTATSHWWRNEAEGSIPLIASLLRLARPAHTVDATVSNQLIRPGFPGRTDLSGSTQSALARAVFCSNQRSRTSLPLRLLQIDSQRVLRRPIETATLIRSFTQFESPLAVQRSQQVRLPLRTLGLIEAKRPAMRELPATQRRRWRPPPEDR